MRDRWQFSINPFLPLSAALLTLAFGARQNLPHEGLWQLGFLTISALQLPGALQALGLSGALCHPAALVVLVVLSFLPGAAGFWLLILFSAYFLGGPLIGFLQKGPWRIQWAWEGPIYAFCLFALGSVLVLALWAGPYQSLFFNEQLMLGMWSNDTSSHINYSLMLKEYGILSSGLHGFLPIRYHIGAHLLLTRLAALIGESPSFAFNFIYPVLMVPFFLSVAWSFMKWMLSLVMNGRRLDARLILPFLFFTALWVQPFRQNPFLSKSGVWTDWVSESYIVSLTFFIPFLHWLLTRTECSASSHYGKWRSAYFWLVPVWLAGMVICKVSTGFCACIAYGTIVLIDWKWRGRPLPYLEILLSALGALVMAKLATKSQAVAFEWGFFVKHYIGGQWLRFFVVHYYPLWAAAILAFFLHRNGKKISLEIWSLFAVAAAIFLGTLPTIHYTIQGGSAAYFTHMVQPVAIPLLGAFIAALILESQWGVKEITVPVLALLVGLSLWPNIKAARAGSTHIPQLKRRVESFYSSLVPLSAIQKFILALREIRESEPLDTFVFIPQTEKKYWLSAGGEYALLIMNQSWRPAIFGFVNSPGFLENFNESGSFWIGDYAKSLPRVPSVKDACNEAGKFGVKHIAVLTWKEAAQEVVKERIECP